VIDLLRIEKLIGIIQINPLLDKDIESIGVNVIIPLHEFHDFQALG